MEDLKLGEYPDREAMIEICEQNLPSEKFCDLYDVLRHDPLREKIYGLSKIIYNNILLETEQQKYIIKSIGHYANKVGGFDMMSHLYYIIALLSPLSNSDDIEIRCLSRELEYAWNGIGSWKA